MIETAEQDGTAGGSVLTASLWVGYLRCGKSTQTEALKRLGDPVFVTGDELKAAAKANPDDARLDPIRIGGLVEDPVVNWYAKRWTLRQITERVKNRERLYFDGVPRKVGQLAMIDFLRIRGYSVKVIQFTTPPEVCDARPVRDGRFEDIDPAIVARRREEYMRETAPMIDLLPDLGISEEKGNMLCIDNTNLAKEDVAAQIIEFLKLPYTVAQMFPNIPHYAPARSASGMETGRRVLSNLEVSLPYFHKGQHPLGESPENAA